MAKPKLAWWILPGVVTGSLTMLGGLGTCAVKYAKFESLPAKVEAGEAALIQSTEALKVQVDQLNAQLDQASVGWDSLTDAQRIQAQQRLDELEAML
mgnify:CR=1 FL=1